MRTLANVTSTPIRPELISFGKRLRQARKRLGLNGAELASKLGLRRAAITQYETGRSFPSVAVLKKLTQSLGVTMDALVFDEYEETATIQDKELATYFVKADHLKHDERSLIKGFIDSLLARAELEELKRVPRKGKKAA